jgi:GH25 family lysozyme M1 (1,4-beta-N-acetylmuramidase)
MTNAVYLPLVMSEFVVAEEESMADRVLGTDTSHWSGSINFDTMYNAGAKFWITKATDAYKTTPFQYEDSKFMEFSTAAFQHGKILAGCYHWLQLSIDPKVAADYYLERYNRFFFDFPPILDFEERYVIDTGKFSDYAWRAQMWLEHVELKTGRKPIIYTAKWYTDYFKSEYISWMSKYPLWVADYTWTSNTLGYPTRMPTPWTKQKMWQFSADGNNRGAEFGIAGDDICLDWYDGSYDNLLSFLGISIPEPPPVIPSPELILPSLKVIKNVNIRSQPNTSASVLGYHVAGDMLDVLEVKPISAVSVWVRDERGWSAIVHYGVRYME